MRDIAGFQAGAVHKVLALQVISPVLLILQGKRMVKGLGFRV